MRQKIVTVLIFCARLIPKFKTSTYQYYNV